MKVTASVNRSVNFNTCLDSGRHHHNKDTKQACQSRKVSYAAFCRQILFPPPAPGSHLRISSRDSFAFSKVLYEYTRAHLRDWLLHLSITLCVPPSRSLLFLGSIRYMEVPRVVCFPIEGHLSWFQLLTIINNLP